VLWGGFRDRDSIAILEVWERWATDVRGGALPCGHFVMEEAPNETLEELRPFLA